MALTTLVLGASENPERYAYKAIMALLRHGHPVSAVGNRMGSVGEIEIVTNWPKTNAIDTLTLYVGKKHQKEIVGKIICLNPRRVIFNPGTENADLQNTLQQAGIEVEEACTLVLLATNQYES
jgi:uncharacterized protein